MMKMFLVLEGEESSFVSMFVAGCIPRVGDIVDYDFRKPRDAPPELSEEIERHEAASKGVYRVTRVQFRYTSFIDSVTSAAEAVFLFVVKEKG